MLDTEILKESEIVLKTFPGAERKIIIALSASPDEVDEIRKCRFVGFPAVAIYWGNEIIYRHEGFIQSDSMVKQIEELLEVG